MKTTLKLIAALIVILAVIAGALYAIWLHDKTASRTSDVEIGVIAHWSDGDTVRLEDGTRVRLLLIDAPESVSPDTEENSPQGQAASAWVKERFPVPYRVWMTFDVERQDHYGRTLCYLWDEDPSGHLADDGFVRDHMLNARILASGHATVLQVKPNGEPYIDLFRRIERESTKSNNT